MGYFFGTKSRLPRRQIMTVPSESPRFFRLHHCAAHGHYHFITGPENISWPVWSREGILRLIDFSRAQMLVKLRPEDVSCAERELVAIRDEANRLGRTQRRSRGKFAKGFLIPRYALPAECDIAVSWARFRRGEASCMSYVAHEPFGTMFLPLYCDFVGRDEPKPEGQSFTRTEWIRLAEKPARIVTMAELGLAA
jgi:hypothetical protein